MSSSSDDDLEAFLASLRPKKKEEKYRFSSGSIDDFVVADDYLSYEGDDDSYPSNSLDSSDLQKSLDESKEDSSCNVESTNTYPTAFRRNDYQKSPKEKKDCLCVEEGENSLHHGESPGSSPRREGDSYVSRGSDHPGTDGDSSSSSQKKNVGCLKEDKQRLNESEKSVGDSGSSTIESIADEMSNLGLNTGEKVGNAKNFQPDKMIGKVKNSSSVVKASMYSDEENPKMPKGSCKTPSRGAFSKVKKGIKVKPQLKQITNVKLSGTPLPKHSTASSSSKPSSVIAAPKIIFSSDSDDDNQVFVDANTKSHVKIPIHSERSEIESSGKEKLKQKLPTKSSRALFTSDSEDGDSPINQSGKNGTKDSLPVTKPILTSSSCEGSSTKTELRFPSTSPFSGKEWSNISSQCEDIHPTRTPLKFPLSDGESSPKSFEEMPPKAPVSRDSEAKKGYGNCLSTDGESPVKYDRPAIVSSRKKTRRVLLSSDDSEDCNSDLENDVIFVDDEYGDKENLELNVLESPDTDFSSDGVFKTPRGFPKKTPKSYRKIVIDSDEEEEYIPLVSRINGESGRQPLDSFNDLNIPPGKTSKPKSGKKTAPPTLKQLKSCLTDKSEVQTKQRSNGLPPGLPPNCEKGVGFKRNRDLLTQKLYRFFNDTVFSNKLPSEMIVEWDKRLRKTAGVTKCSRQTVTTINDGIRSISKTYTARISLSEKVLDTLYRLRDTLCHEMCHAAVWLIDNENDGHGPFWKGWARKASAAHPEMPVVKRCHSYDITYKFHYQCTACRKVYGRHSKSIKVDEQACGVCRGRLVLLSQHNSDGTPAKARQPNKFAMFVKDNYKTVRESKSLGGATPKHSDVMKALSEKFATLSTKK